MTRLDKSIELVIEHDEYTDKFNETLGTPVC